MSAITKTAAYIRAIVDRFQHVVNEKDRSDLIALGIGRTLAFDLALPTSPVASVQVYFSQNHYPHIAAVVSEFNEYAIIDTRLACDMAFKFYKLRYELLHCPQQHVGLICLLGKQLPEVFPQKICDLLHSEASTGINVYDAWRDLTYAVKTAVEEDERAKGVVTPALATAVVNAAQ